jgi:precorrin-6B methylase 2
LGATVLLQAPQGFAGFAAGFPGIDGIIADDAIHVDFDFWISLISLPRAFAVDPHAVPADVPYVHADPARQQQWASRLRPAHGLAVGLVWAGNPNHAADRHRSLPLAALAPLGDVQGARFFALQKGEREREAEAPPAGFAIINLGPDLRDFRDTAAVVSQLDVVITVDTAVAHLAGAMGREVWLLLARNAEWRWLANGEASAWYPTMRLFRQRRDGDWGEVIERVRVALRGLAGAAVQPSATGKTPSLADGSASVRLAPPDGAKGESSGRAVLSGVAHTRVGVLQYLPGEALEGESLRLYGEFLQPQLDLIATLLPPGSTVLEVGSGIGSHAIPLAAMVREGGRLQLCESRLPHRQVLGQNLAVHHVANVALMPMAGGEAVDALQLGRLDLLKVNAGANPMTVLAGAEAALWQLRPLLFIAVADSAAIELCAARLKDFGYRCWRMATPLFNAGNFNRRTEDAFSGAVALALLGVPEEIERTVTQTGCVEI